VPDTRSLIEGALLVAPLFGGLLVHGLCIRNGAFLRLAVPIAPRWFGVNKTYRGIVCVALGTAAGFVILSPGFASVAEAPGRALVGALVGGSAMLAELPNSFLKRRLGIAPGTQASGSRGVAFHVLDQVDVWFGAWAILAWVATPSPGRLLGSALALYLGHQVASLLGYWLGMRTTAR
jgi:hypothetical protein